MAKPFDPDRMPPTINAIRRMLTDPADRERFEAEIGEACYLESRDPAKETELKKLLDRWAVWVCEQHDPHFAQDMQLLAEERWDEIDAFDSERNRINLADLAREQAGP